MTTPDPEPLAEEPKPEAKTPSWMYPIVLVVLVGCAFAIFRPTKHAPTDQENRDDAKRACQEKFIPPRLKAPASADFSDVTVNLLAGTYTVAGTVDSQNAFGAKVRGSFSCVMHSSGDRWVLDSANVDG